MTIQLNADKNLNIHEAFAEQLKELLTGELSNFDEEITRLEVHLSDQNGAKEGQLDKRCMIEARLEGRQPIAVTANADTHEKSVAAATGKLKNSLGSIFGRLKKH